MYKAAFMTTVSILIDIFVLKNEDKPKFDIYYLFKKIFVFFLFYFLIFYPEEK